MSPKPDETEDSVVAVPFRSKGQLPHPTYSVRTHGKLTAGQLQRLDGLLTQFWSEEIGALTPASPDSVVDAREAFTQMIHFVRRLHNARRNARRRGNARRGGLSVEMLKALRYYAAEPHSAERVGKRIPSTTTSVALINRKYIEAGSHKVTDLGYAKLLEIDNANVEDASGALEQEA